MIRIDRDDVGLFFPKEGLMEIFHSDGSHSSHDEQRTLRDDSCLRSMSIRLTGAH